MVLYQTSHLIYTVCNSFASVFGAFGARTFNVILPLLAPKVTLSLTEFDRKEGLHLNDLPLLLQGPTNGRAPYSGSNPTLPITSIAAGVIFTLTSCSAIRFTTD